MPTIHANGLDIGYDTHGTGPPIVMLHGATSLGREDFAAQIPFLTRAFRLILPDARGHGRTRWDAADGFHHDWLVDDVEALVDGLGLDTFHLLGFSMGGMTALRFAVRAPARVQTLVVAGITTQREPRTSVARRLMDPARIDREDPDMAANMARRHDAGQGEGAWRRLLPAIAADVASQPLLSPRDMRRIDAPALVVAGDRDPFVPVDHAWGIARQLSNGRLFIVPDGGHEVTARRPALVNEGLSGFYRATDTTASAQSGGAQPGPAATTAGPTATPVAAPPAPATATPESARRTTP